MLPFHSEILWTQLNISVSFQKLTYAYNVHTLLLNIHVPRCLCSQIQSSHFLLLKLIFYLQGSPLPMSGFPKIIPGGYAIKTL